MTAHSLSHTHENMVNMSEHVERVAKAACGYTLAEQYAARLTLADNVRS